MLEIKYKVANGSKIVSNGEVWTAYRRKNRNLLDQAEGLVKEVFGDKARVLTDRKEMCAECVAKSFCDMFGSGKQMLSDVLNPIGAKPGDVVKIGIPSGTVTKASMVVYMMPAIGLMGGAVVGWMTGKSNSFDINVSTLIGTLVGLGLSMIAVRYLNDVLSKKPSYQPEIIEIVNPDNLTSEGESSY